MRTKIIVHRTHSEAYSEYSKECKEKFSTNKFRMYPTFLTYDCDGVKTIHASLDEWHSTVLPRGEDVSVELCCMLTEEERLMLTREWVIR